MHFFEVTVMPLRLLCSLGARLLVSSLLLYKDFNFFPAAR